MIRTKACDALGITHPVVMAGMGGASNPALVAAVSEAGGLGILACTWSSIDEIRRSIREIRERTAHPFGVNFVLHLADPAALDECVSQGVPVFSFFRGDPAKAVAKVHDAGAVALHQVTTLAEADQAVDAGVDVIVAQGREAGGHMGPLPLWQFLPEVVERAGGRPVLAAGGIVDGKGLAAALSFGASGVMMGTRFIACGESPATALHKQAILDAKIGDTVDSGVWDMLRGEDWPGVKVRSLRNSMTEKWAGREDELAVVLDSVRAEFIQAERLYDVTKLPLLAGEGAGRIKSALSAQKIMEYIMSEAERLMNGAGLRDA